MLIGVLTQPPLEVGQQFGDVAASRRDSRVPSCECRQRTGISTTGWVGRAGLGRVCGAAAWQGDRQRGLRGAVTGCSFHDAFLLCGRGAVRIASAKENRLTIEKADATIRMVFSREANPAEKRMNFCDPF